VNEAAQVVTQAAGDDANVIFGAVIDPSLDGDLLITVVATGFGVHGANMRLVEQRMHHRPQPLAVVGGGHPAEPVRSAEVAASGSTTPAWQRRESKPSWGRSGGSRADSLEVPTFLRRNMD